MLDALFLYFVIGLIALAVIILIVVKICQIASQTKSIMYVLFETQTVHEINELKIVELRKELQKEYDLKLEELRKEFQDSHGN